MLPVASSSDSSELQHSHSRLALIRDVVPEPPRQAGINPLMDAASPIFSYLRSLRSLSALPDTAMVKKNIEKKLKMFLEKIKQDVEHEEQLVLCHYALSATIDDIMQHHMNREVSSNTWRNDRLLMTVETAPETSMRFFAILEHLMEAPAANLNLLEFFYLCLTLGYMGPYRRSLQHAEYQRIVDELYKCIRVHRTAVPSTSSSIPALVSEQLVSSVVPWRFLFFSFSISLLLVLALGYELYASIAQFRF